MTIKQDLRSINKDIKALSKKMDGLLKTVEKSEAAKPNRRRANQLKEHLQKRKLRVLPPPNRY